MEVGHLDPLVPEISDPRYNANVWRNFSGKEDFRFSSQKGKVTSFVASMYPLSIPPPSRMGDFTYARYIQHGDVYKDPVMRKKQITWSENEIRVSS